jgi:hypothetical protein
MDTLLSCKVFLAVVGGGGFAAAADQLERSFLVGRFGDNAYWDEWSLRMKTPTVSPRPRGKSTLDSGLGSK